MISGLWGKKVGMTQIFKDDYTVIPVTVIDTSSWVISQVKTEETDGYHAVQIGNIKDRYASESFKEEWLKQPKKYFSTFREVKLAEPNAELKVGQPFEAGLEEGSSVDVFGTTIGKGFAGVVKRWRFGGGRATHGSTFHRAPGSLSFHATQGRVHKGKKLPGHMGAKQRVMKNLEVIKNDANANIVLVKGSVPGKAGSLVFVRKNK